MKKYIQTFTKTVWGFYEVEAENEEDAQKKFDDGDYDQFDNESEDTELGKWEAQE